ncbi:cytochrome C4 [Defluviimonas sp. 20V17]|uniref:Cytochrome c4 n=1 Tax=Allgaiera indica TaxID=765699 RepID=A0AAN4UV95_9RHOB|nr:FAD-dependent oxidoreductase [Allgaiera indica]KDB04655.1 cytochrome C4 [Defluviimonas sp. 20V17]GHE06002.1 cytochrome c4 [Allgaiera indica]SDX82685.1 D-amino-acid dehydrogenase [Allgaiera indica]
MATARTEIAVIGAGVIGLTIALRLARAGREVVILDPETPGSGASWGNAGTIADYAVMPVGTPSVLRDLPSLLLDRNSPLAIRRAALPALAPWLLRFLRQSLPDAAPRNAQALAALNADAARLWLSLAAEIGGEDLLNRNGCLYLYESPKDRAAGEADMAGRRDLGVTVELVDPDTLAGMEPALPPIAGGGAFFPQAIFLSDPGEMVARLARAAQAAGVRHLSARVTGLAREGGGVRLSGPDLTLAARHAVIAAGAHSRPLARQAGDRIPLDTERGYHVEYDMPAPRLSRPASPSARGFYMCPMTGRLRVAGTVELGGLTAPPSVHRIARLDQGARALFPDLPAPARSWMGFRPSMPDSLPVIGPSRAGAEILHAYGHGHIGLTLAPKTARLIEAALAGRSPDEMGPCLPSRFS